MGLAAAKKLTRLVAAASYCCYAGSRLRSSHLLKSKARRGTIGVFGHSRIRKSQAHAAAVVCVAVPAATIVETDLTEICT